MRPGFAGCEALLVSGRPKTKWAVLLGVAALAGLGYAALALLGPTEWVFRQELKQGRKLVERVETFRLQQHRLPDEREVDSIRAEMGWSGPDQCPCYRRDSAGQYIIWFQGRSLGASVTYDSRTRAWSEGG